MIKTSNSQALRRGLVGLGVGLCGSVAAVAMALPSASAAPDVCSPQAVAGIVSSVTGAARQYLSGHPGANQVLTQAYTQPRADAASNIRGYFTANPGEYYELRSILAPIGDTQRQCNVTVLPPDLASAYDQFMAG